MIIKVNFLDSVRLTIKNNGNKLGHKKKRDIMKQSYVKVFMGKSMHRPVHINLCINSQFKSATEIENIGHKKKTHRKITVLW